MIQKSVSRVLLAWHKKGNVCGNIAEQVEGSKWQVEGSGCEERRVGERGGNGWGEEKEEEGEEEEEEKDTEITV